MASSSTRSILAAIIGNSVVMVSKFIGFFITSSSAMLAEAIHSFADVMNQSLLLVGVLRSNREADPLHKSGYGRERFVWSLISAVGIFFLGCGITLYHGVHHLLHPTPHEPFSMWGIAILIFSFVIEFYVLYVVYKELSEKAGEKPFWKYLRTEADPSSVAVFMEDSAACIGVLIALASVGLTQLTHQGYWDAIGSILIAILLGAIAVWLIARNRELLIGQSIPEEDMKKLQSILKSKDFLGKIDHIRTEVIGSESYDIQVEIEFDEQTLAKKLTLDLRKEYDSIETYDDFVLVSQKIAQRSMEHLTHTIDELEKEIQQAIPESKFIDIEPN